MSYEKDIGYVLLPSIVKDLTEIATPFGETSLHRALKFFCKIPCPFLQRYI